jgi:hypothetical protein
MATSKKPPWKRPRPKKTAKRKLTPAQKQRAKASARKAGRRYPNLVDNMRVSREAATSGKKRATPKGKKKPRAPRKRKS